LGQFADEEHIPVVRFTKTDRKIERMRPYLVAQAATGRSGVAAIGVAQEFASVSTGTQRDAPNVIPWFSFAKADRRVTCCYFYLWDIDFGPAFIKICAHFPYPAKIWRPCRSARRPGERTGRRTPGLVVDRLAESRGERTASAATNLHGIAAGDLATVRNLRKLMLRSRANALVSVRRVTEINAGRKTAGVDGKVALLRQPRLHWPTGRSTVPARGPLSPSSGCISARLTESNVR
jgi:hypothetical protein